MLMQVVVWVLVAIAAVVVGRKAGTMLFGAKKDVSNLKRSAQVLAIALRAHGLQRLPAVLEEFVVGDIPDLLDSIHAFATLVRAGNESIVKELDGTFIRMLEAKLNSPEGRAAIKVRLAEAEKIALEVAKVAIPVVLAVV